MTCTPKEEMVEARIKEVLTRYRESPNLLHLIRVYLGAAVDVHNLICDLPSKFNIDDAVGDQLTKIGKRLGWPRCHCICDISPVFGFDCGEVSIRPITGFCDDNSSWENCSLGISDICLNDDETYRKFLKVRAYQVDRRYDLKSLEDCLDIFFGPASEVLYSGQGRVVIAPGRDLTPGEIALLQLYPRVLPVALGIRVMFHFGETRVFGFGTGWGGLMEIDEELTHSGRGYQRTDKVFGFCETDGEIGGFCEMWEENGLPLKTELEDADGNPVYIVDENGNQIYTGALTEHANWQCRSSAPWMCEVDVRPYSC